MRVKEDSYRIEFSWKCCFLPSQDACKRLTATELKMLSFITVW